MPSQTVLFIPKEDWQLYEEPGAIKAMLPPGAVAILGAWNYGRDGLVCSVKPAFSGCRLEDLHKSLPTCSPLLDGAEIYPRMGDSRGRTWHEPVAIERRVRAPAVLPSPTVLTAAATARSVPRRDPCRDPCRDP